MVIHTKQIRHISVV